MNQLKQWLNKSTKPTTQKNEYIPPMGVNDAHRSEYFTNYNNQLMQEIRRVKLNEGR